jgi:hypothetical protein
MSPQPVERSPSGGARIKLLDAAVEIIRQKGSHDSEEHKAWVVDLARFLLDRLQDGQFSVAQKSSKAFVEGY